MKKSYWKMMFLAIYVFLILSCVTSRHLQSWKIPIYTSDNKVMYKEIQLDSLDESKRITITIDSVDVSFILPGEGWKKKIIPATDSTLEVYQFYSSTWPDSGLFMEIAVDEGLINFREAAIGLRLLLLEDYGIQFAVNTPERAVESLAGIGEDEANGQRDKIKLTLPLVEDNEMGGKVIKLYEKEEATKSGKQKFIYLDSAMGSFAIRGNENKLSLELLVRMKCPYIQFYNGMDKIMMGIWNSIKVPNAYVIEIEE